MRILNLEEIGNTDEKLFILKNIENAMNELTPEKAIRNNFNISLENFESIYLIGFGKAAYGMYSGIRDMIQDKLKYAGIIIPDDEEVITEFPELKIMRGTHPYVSQTSVDSSVKLISEVKNLSCRDLIIVLISGGGSSLFEIPENGINIHDIMDISKEIMDNDGDIYTLNRIRSRLSSVKGGKLAKLLYPARVVSYIISDVIYDDMSIIASGPLVQPDFQGDISELVSEYVRDPDLAKLILEKGNLGSIEKKYFSSVENHLILNNYDFVNAIFSAMNGEKINLGSNVHGDVNSVAYSIAALLRTVYSMKGRGFMFVCGGETTVNVQGTGSGGRNQELVLKLFEYMKKGENFTFCAIGTDGIDGKSPAAGGIVDQDTKISGLDVYLKNNDSYTALLSCKGAIMTGRTGNNVSDIIVGYYSGANDNF